MLIVKNFTKKYSGLPILSVAEMHLSPGIFWVKGQNGSGKTTFFKSLAGLLPHSGEIYFDDQISLKDNPVAYRMRVNYSEAEPVYPGFLTAKDLIHFIGKAKGASKTQCHWLVDYFGLNSFHTKACETYSSGMLKKLSLVLAFLGKPQVIILDEPLITLDEHARNNLFELINHTLDDRPVIFLISSHQLIENTSITISQTYSIQNKEIVLA